MNRCLCVTSNFVEMVARCTPSSDRLSVYAALLQNCQGTNTPLQISQAQFLALGEGSSATARPPSETTSSTRPPPSPTSITRTVQTTINGMATTLTAVVTVTPMGGAVVTTVIDGQTVTVSQDPQVTGDYNNNGNSNSNSGNNNGGGSGLSEGVKYGLIAGGSVAGLAVIAGFIMVYLRRRRRLAHANEEAHPMLPFGGATTKWDPSISSSHGHSDNYVARQPTPSVYSASAVTPSNDHGYSDSDGKWQPGGGPLLSAAAAANQQQAGWTPAYPATAGYDGKGWGAGGVGAGQSQGHVAELPPPGPAELAVGSPTVPAHQQQHQFATELPSSPVGAPQVQQQRFSGVPWGPDAYGQPGQHGHAYNSQQQQWHG